MPSTVGIVASGIFTPLDLSPALWLDASDTSTITESSGAVSQWNDKSGNGYNVSQASAALQPTTGSATQNGRNVISFNSDRLVSGTVSLPSGNSARSVFVVTKRTSGQYPFAWGAASNNQTWAFDISATSVSQRIVAFANDWQTGEPANSTWQIIQGWHDGTNARYQVNNGTVRGPSARTYATAATPIIIGQFTSVGGGPLVGDVAELLIFSRALTSSEQQLVRDYLNTKWAVY